MQFGVIGCGRVSQIMHLPHLEGLHGVAIEAIADPAENVIDAMGDRYGVSKRYRDGAELIEEQRTELDAVVIATPSQMHREIGVAALEAGLHRRRTISDGLSVRGKATLLV